MCKPPVLTIFNPQFESILECDASLKACGICLKQRSPDGAVHVVAYHSQVFTPAQTRYCTTRREALSVMVGLTKYRHFLLNRTVTVETDHASLCHIMRSKNLSAQLQRYREYMADYDIQWKHVPGKFQVISDFLSRLRPCDSSATDRCRQCREGRGADWDKPDLEEGLHEPELTCSARDGAACRIMTRADYRKQNMHPRAFGENEQTAETGGTDTAGETHSNSAGASRAHGEKHDGPMNDRITTRAISKKQDVSRNLTQETGVVVNSVVHLNQLKDATDADASGDGTKPTARRRNRKRGNLLKLAAPAAYKDIIEKKWSVEYIVKEQQADSTLSHVRTWLESGIRPKEMPSEPELRDYWLQFDALKLDNGLLYRQYFDTSGSVKDLQILIPPSMRTTIMELIHAAVGHAQMSIKNEHMLARHAYWPSWKKSVKIFVAACRRCLEYARCAPARQGNLNPTAPTIGGPGELLSIDLVGKLPMSNGYQYILSAQDVFTKYLFLIPLRDKTAEHVTDALMKIFLSHGFYPLIKSDLGSEFIHSIQADLDKVTQSVRITTTAYTPRNNPVERCHKELHAIIAKLLDNHKTWSDVLNYVQFVYNTTSHLATGFTPAYLQYGRDIHTSLNLLLPSSPEVVTSYGEYTQTVVSRMEIANMLARDTLGQAAEMAKRAYNKHVRPASFKPGDTVLVYYPRKCTGKFPKWQRLYSIEGKIQKKLSDVSYIVYDVSGKRNRIVHVDKIKLLSSSDQHGDIHEIATLDTDE